MGILEELWYGNISPCERDFKKGSKYSELLGYIVRHEEDLQKRLNDAYAAFARPINLREATFNAQYAPGSLLLEIGAAGNSVEEARSSAFHLGKVLAEMILDS